VLALVPGASRSGVTITAGLFTGLDRGSAARFSFLLSIPAITAAGLYKLAKVAIKDHGFGHQLGPYLLAAVVAAAVAYVVVNWFLKFMYKHTTVGFILYRIVLGAGLLILLQSGEIKAQPNEPSTSGQVLKQLRHGHDFVAPAPNALNNHV